MDYVAISVSDRPLRAEGDIRPGVVAGLSCRTTDDTRHPPASSAELPKPL